MNTFVVPLLVFLILSGAANQSKARGLRNKQKNSWWSKRGMTPPLPPSSERDPELFLQDVATSPGTAFNTGMSLGDLHGYAPPSDVGEPQVSLLSPCLTQAQQQLAPARYWLLLADLARQYGQRERAFRRSEVRDEK
ncbi:uncharacterized protein LOC122257426 [Penaeus japonicus]|uniref:uncharacterized protein LOC122257426 n=1 Tax=Penaeus japonicus TaxID=27405 RepID=UPI001C715423|nr:uncharacterized protein LOC122257426 [Penaeus japonicus]